ncbi:hypothetical protein MYCTH_2299561 [Thermothelomyces thermophilus ATCC 42464]|uniref:ASTRA-associated protein 1 n=1 Tax=Thermothelomyces thermophilus (strain ATCC 42464 / BCRC 31852 / DSM 1799) TaxID=573729 RepID=G2Q6K7_THET4|nr:uncharacterized protein MYCTH_2299561 [Thermothelomyces thermophilus ATCC 42464]AEO55580.1 hypothetical protein MYCTH_2299561 [Thermothelomyces thermophilus ATCC 42464]
MATDGRPAQPESILRGHKAQVHVAAFVRSNDRLVTGDADGFVVAWDLTIMRPRAVWQAHRNAILGIAGWGEDRLITHGRDNKLIVWKFSAEEESRLSTKLPLDTTPEPRPQPWILHMLEVNTMNFCSFAHCPASPGPGASPSGSSSSEIFVAVPNTLASEAIDIFHLPSQVRRHTVKLGDKNGMVMALAIFYRGHDLTLVAGYENGKAMVAQLTHHGDWSVRYQASCHSQPVLSLDVSPGRDFFLTSSADAIIAKHPLPSSPQPATQQLSSPQPDPAPGTPPPPTSDNRPDPASGPSTTAQRGNPSKSLLTAALSGAGPPSSSSSSSHQPIHTTTVHRPGELPAQQPIKTVNTRHAGQQSLRIRSDGRVFATAGWDARVRVYSAKTLAEVAVLKWHAAGCYATAFASLDNPAAQVGEGEGEREGKGKGKGKEEEEESETPTRQEEGGGEGGGPRKRLLLEGREPDDDEHEGGTDEGKEVAVVPKLVDVTVRDRRVQQARRAHWLAAGSKDGKVSLWDVF